MKYKINIHGMDCKGCVALIGIALEEKGFTEIHVNLESNNALFISDDDIESVKSKLDKIFPELPHHSYDGLQLI